MLVSVLVPSYRRPADLERCLAAISAQHRAADQVLVVARVGDQETFSVVQKWRERLPLDVVEITVPGVVQAMAAGLARCECDVLAITDDDAAPRPDWLERIERPGPGLLTSNIPSFKYRFEASRYITRWGFFGPFCA